MTNTISCHSPKPHARRCGLKTGGLLQDILSFHYILQKSTHILTWKKALLGFGFLSLAESQADSWCKLSVSAAADCSEHTLLLTGLVSSACSSLQALYYQHTETGLPAQVEEASVWLYLLTEMLCRSLVPHLHTPNSEWWEFLAFKAGWMKPGGGCFCSLFVNLCSVYLGVALGIIS